MGYLKAKSTTPKGTKNHGGVVVAHGYCGNLQHMQPMSIELVKRGFTVVNIDFRGHGASGGYLNRFELINDVKAAVDYLEYNVSHVSEIGLVGHSMGGGAVLSFARTYPDRVNATVAIGAVPDERNDMKNISNLLMAIGLFEQGATKAHLIEALKLYTDLDDVQIGVLYSGDFADGNNTKAFVGSFSEHIFEVKDPTILHEMVQWFEQAFNGVEASDITITVTAVQVFSYISLFGVVMLVFIAMVHISNKLFKRQFVFPEIERLKGTKDVSINKLILCYAVPVVLIGFAIFMFFAEFFTGMIPLSASESTLSLIIGNAIGTIVIYYFLVLRKEKKGSFGNFINEIKEMSSTNSRKSILFGIISALLLILCVSSIWHWSTQNTLPSLKEFGTIMAIALVTFPFFIIKEFYFRTVQGKLKTSNRYKKYFTMVGIGVFMDNLLLGLLMVIAWLHIYSVLSALYLSVWLFMSIVLEFAATWAYMWSGRNILGSAIFRGIFFAWISVIFFPYGFL